VRLAGGGTQEGVRVLDITGPEALTMSDVAAQMCAAWGTEVRCEETDLHGALERLVAAGVMSSPASQSLGHFLRRIGEQCDVVVTESVEQVAGGSPTRLVQFLRDYAQEFS
jgi:uncharacterized protein YbjT (DUF2867 family)